MWCCVCADSNDQLSEILSLQQSHECRGRAIQPLNDIFDVLDLSSTEPLGHLLLKLSIARAVVVEDDESLYADATLQECRHDLRRAISALGRFRVVVVRDQSAQRDARTWIEQPQNGVKHYAADTLKVHVNSIRTGLRQLLLQLWTPMVDALIEPELLHRVAALFRAAGNADNPASLQLRDLTDD